MNGEEVTGADKRLSEVKLLPGHRLVADQMQRQSFPGWIAEQ